ncbi:MAG TPA: alpha/beta hydrolase domain-containing protein [Gemmatimonadales bacterium]|nr:alpha/beta hydrolase domain-containing protein [Gemmatimonadales bacterium]
MSWVGLDLHKRYVTASAPSDACHRGTPPAPLRRGCSWLASLLLAPVLLIMAGSRAAADVVRVEVDRREVLAGGVSWGSAGAYERLVGRVFFEFDPAHPADALIVDLRFAPRNARGKVEVWSEFVIYKPVDSGRGSGVTLFEIPNRGGGSLVNVPAASAMRGENSYLLRMGLTIVHLGWQADLSPGPATLRLHAPRAGDATRRIAGLVRTRWVVQSPTTVLPVTSAASHPVLDPDGGEHRLLVRADPLGDPAVVPRASWRFARLDGERVVADPGNVYLAGGFAPGRIYELVYRSADPLLVGAGLAAVRDMAEYLRDDPTSIAPTRYVVARGFSQSGRFLRHLVYQGFHLGSGGQRVFDGLFIIMAGGSRGSFNHRFAQPSTASGNHPTRLFPFASAVLTDPVTGARDGLLAHAGDSTQLPRIFYLDGGHEYWGSAASLTHISPDGTHDISLLPNERRYVLASADHSANARDLGPEEDARTPGTTLYRVNPLEGRPVQRALLTAMIEWIISGREPPPSRYPTIARGTLVAADAVRFPHIPGVAVPSAAVPIHHLDFGPRWPEGIIDFEPPRLGGQYPVQVGQVDSIGNEIDGIRMHEVEVPLATYLPWQLNTGAAAAVAPLVSEEGSIVPLPRTEVERRTAGDPRPSVEVLYRNRDEYLARVRRVVERLVQERFVLPDDVAGELSRAERIWAWVTAARGASSRN